VFLGFVTSSLVSSVLGKRFAGIGWEEHLQSYLSCVKWDIKP